jgi:hypothetical protein
MDKALELNRKDKPDYIRQQLSGARVTWFRSVSMATSGDADQTHQMLRSRSVANQKKTPSSLSSSSPSSVALTARRLSDDDTDAFAHLTAADDAHGQGVAYRYIFPRRSDSLHFFFTSRLYVILRAGGVAVGLFERWFRNIGGCSMRVAAGRRPTAVAAGARRAAAPSTDLRRLRRPVSPRCRRRL